MIITPRDEQVGSNPEQHERIVEMRAKAASLLDLDTPATRARLCQMAGWGRGRVYDLIAEAFPAEGCDALSAQHGPVRLTREGDKIIMRRA